MLTQVLAAIGNGLFMLVATAVALRLLLLWWRTREWPELLIGAGLLMPAAVALPFMVASGIGAASIAEVHLVPLAVGLLGIVVSVACLMAFTWLVFRRNSRAAAAFSIATAIGAACACALFFRAIANAPAEAAPIDVHGPYSLAIRLCFEIWYAWTGVESLREWSRARRRLALDLSDPVLVNRFGLWGCMGVGLALNGAGAMALEAAGMDLMRDPLPAFWMALNGLLAGSLMFLAFVPPTRYLDWVTTRHRRRAHARAA